MRLVLASILFLSPVLMKWWSGNRGPDAERVLQALARLGSEDPPGPRARAERASQHHSGEDLLAFRVLWTLQDLLQRGELGSGQATVGFRALAPQLRWIEAALARIVENAVLHAIARVASSEHGHFDGRELRGLDVAGGIG